VCPSPSAARSTNGDVKVTRPAASRGIDPARIVLWFCIAFTVQVGIFPVLRIFFPHQMNYNEGWNVYNATAITNHQLLYPVKYGWTTVNYPMLSFVLMAQLHKITHDYLFTARIISLLSLVGTAIVIRAIVIKLGGTNWGASLAGLFCYAIFCTTARGYVGADDPQLLAQFIFISGLYVYLLHRESYSNIALAALIFVIGGSIKHNQIDIPLAVMIDLAFISLSRTAWFGACGVVMAAISVLVQQHFGGPYLISELAGGRIFHISVMLHTGFDSVGLVFPSLLFSIYIGWLVLRDPERRIAGILLFLGLSLGSYFAGASGVAVNIFFSTFMAMAVLLGLFFSTPNNAEWAWANKPKIMTIIPVIIFLSLYLAGGLDSFSGYREIKKSKPEFIAETSFLTAHPGPAICESILLCNFAGKPFIYDPFNATRLINDGKLDPNVIIDAIHQRRYAAIEISSSLANPTHSQHFTPAIMAAIQSTYVPGLAFPDTVIYVPTPEQR
jgi:hypothetical protein